MDVGIKSSLSIIAACLAFAGCAVLDDPAVGQGPIALSPAAHEAFTDYRSQRTPRYFAVSLDGRAYYYSFCDAGRCLRQPKTSVVEQCQSFSNGVPCRIYASHGSIVWSGAQVARAQW